MEWEEEREGKAAGLDMVHIDTHQRSPNDMLSERRQIKTEYIL